MRVDLKNGKFRLQQDLPLPDMLLQDVLDKLRTTDHQVTFEIMQDGKRRLPESLVERSFTADIGELNWFAHRLDHMGDTEYAAFGAVLQRYPVLEFLDALRSVTGLEKVRVWRARSLTEFGEQLMEDADFRHFWDSILHRSDGMDPVNVGRMAAQYYDAVYHDGWVCGLSEYEFPVEIEMPKPELSIYNVFAVEYDESDHKCGCGEWLTLPISESYFHELLRTNRTLRCERTECILPGIVIRDAVDLEEMNHLAAKLTALPHDDLIKLKAAIEQEQPVGIIPLTEMISHLPEYDFDPSASDESFFGQKYLERMLPSDFDFRMIRETELTAFGGEVLRHKGGSVTSYGAISGRGEQLYTILSDGQEPVEEQEEVTENSFCPM